jgi:hypothetical protein
VETPGALEESVQLVPGENVPVTSVETKLTLPLGGGETGAVVSVTVAVHDVVFVAGSVEGVHATVVDVGRSEAVRFCWPLLVASLTLPA